LTVDVSINGDRTAGVVSVESFLIVEALSLLLPLVAAPSRLDRPLLSLDCPLPFLFLLRERCGSPRADTTGAKIPEALGMLYSRLVGQSCKQ
jgi:hypothetical protein